MILEAHPPAKRLGKIIRKPAANQNKPSSVTESRPNAFYTGAISQNINYDKTIKPLT
jgi:hypothetical protein